jgi:hypothetical protein
VDETRYLLSLLPTVQVPTKEYVPQDALSLWNANRLRYNPLASVESNHPTSWMTV